MHLSEVKHRKSSQIFCSPVCMYIPPYIGTPQAVDDLVGMWTLIPEPNAMVTFTKRREDDDVKSIIFLIFNYFVSTMSVHIHYLMHKVIG